jgi:hypothetical protein
MDDGSFQKIEHTAERLYGPRAILFCGYEPAEHGPLTTALAQMGLGDRSILFATDADAERTLGDLLASRDRSGQGQGSAMPRATIMSGFTQSEVHLLMGVYREAGLPRQLWAMLTPASEKWTLAALLEELVAEAEAFARKGR